MITDREARCVIKQYDIRMVDNHLMLLREITERIWYRVHYPHYFVGGPVTRRNSVIPLLLLYQYVVYLEKKP